MNSNTFEFFFFLNYYYLYNWKLFLPNITTELACNSRLILWKCFSETKKIRQTKIIVNVYKGARTRWRDSTAYKGWARNKNVRDTPSGKERVAEKYKFDRDRQTDIQANRQTDRQTGRDRHWQTSKPTTFISAILYFSLARNSIKWLHCGTEFFWLLRL